MSDFIAEKLPAINSPVRPDSGDVIGTQPNLFPFDAFEFDNPNKVSQPKLTMKDPWNLVSSGLEIYEDGVDKENLVEGNRRLIAEGEVLKLQHWDATGQNWIDDISLGGYDALDNFTDFLVARGIIRNVDNVATTESGYGITFVTGLFTKTHYDFCNFNSESLKIGESDLYDTNTMEESSILFNGRPTWQPKE